MHRAKILAVDDEPDFEALLTQRERGITALLGSDDVKLRSSLTLFARAVQGQPLFRSTLQAFFDGA